MFANFEKAFDRISRDKLWAMLLQYGIGGQLLAAIKSLHMHSEVCVRVNSATTNLSKYATTARLLTFTYSVPHIYG